MGTLTIGQVAERTGFTTSSLRYYEGIGLVVPAARSDAGYRLYDERTVDRLAFVARAKQLGCTLEEIADLVAIWDGDECGPVQRRFHDLVTAKVAATQDRLDELTRFADQLRTAAVQLSGAPTDGACGEGCACLAAPAGAPATVPTAGAAAGAGVGTTTPVVLGREAAAGEVPIACTLSAGGVEEREREWGALLAHVSDRTATPDGALRLRLDAATPLEELVRLVTAEQGCCAFFAFTITVDARGTALEVRAPEGAGPVVTTLFGAAA